MWQDVGKNLVFVFKEGVQELIKAELESRNHTEESLLFAKVAQFCRREMLNEGFEFKGNLDARKVLTPTVNWLIS